MASNHEADPNDILELCTPSLQRTNHIRRIQRTSKFLCKCVFPMIFPASFKHAQKIKKNLSFTRLVLSFSTLRTLVLPFSCPLRSVDLFQQSFPDSSTTTPHILITTDTSDSDISAPLSVSPLNCTPADFLPSVSASALPYDNTQHSSYTFMLRTILDGWIQPARNVGSNCLYFI